jgi:hypothetical protein
LSCIIAPLLPAEASAGREIELGSEIYRVLQAIPVLDIAYGFFAQTIGEPRKPGSAGFFKDSSASRYDTAASCPPCDSYTMKGADIRHEAIAKLQ